MSRWRAFRGAEPGFEAVILGNQVHQTAGVVVPGGAQAGSRWRGWTGMRPRPAGMLLTVTVADCIPVYLVDPVRRAIALLPQRLEGDGERDPRAGRSHLVEIAGVGPQDIVMHCGVGICGELL